MPDTNGKPSGLLARGLQAHTDRSGPASSKNDRNDDSHTRHRRHTATSPIRHQITITKIRNIWQTAKQRTMKSGVLEI